MLPPFSAISLSAKRIAFTVLALVSGLAYGQGGSGSGGCGNGQLEVSAIHGTPQELDTEMDKIIAYATKFAKENPNLLSHPNYARAAIWIKPETVSLSAKEKRAIFMNWWSGCQGIRLLELAAAGGNQRNAQHLLDGGADPNIVDSKGPYAENTIFMRCANLASDHKSLSVNGVPYPTRTMIEAEQKIAVYSQLLAKGGDLNRLNQQGLSALHLCKDPEAVAFFLRNGANPNRPVEQSSIERAKKGGFLSTPVLDFRINRILEDYYWERDANFSILQKLLPVIQNKNLEQPTRRRICRECRVAKKVETCQRLAKTIELPKQNLTPLFNGECGQEGGAL